MSLFRRKKPTLRSAVTTDWINNTSEGQISLLKEKLLLAEQKATLMWEERDDAVAVSLMRTLTIRRLEEELRRVRQRENAALKPTVQVIEANVLKEFAHHDLHNLQPHSEIANQWYHQGLEAAQEEALMWSNRRVEYRCDQCGMPKDECVNDQGKPIIDCYHPQESAD